MMLLCCFLVLLLISPSISTDYCVNSTRYSMTYTNNVDVDITTFNNCTGVTHVNLSHNQISSLSNDTFYLLWRIESLDLSFNILTDLGPETFSGLRQLKYLYIMDNMLTTIPLDFFVNKLDLIKVDLSRNKIADIPMEVFDHDMPRIREVILQSNDVRSYEPWAVYYESTHQVIPYIDLKYNKIERFSNTNNFTYNGSRSVYEGSVTDLRSNNITGLDEQFYRQYKPGANELSTIMLEIMIDIRDNDLTCDCYMYPIADSVRRSYFLYAQHDVLKIKCHDPPNLRDKEVFYDVRLTEFVCVVNQDCPSGCVCEERPDAEVINVQCGNGSLEAVPKVLPQNPNYAAYELILNDNGISRIDNVSYANTLVLLQAANNSISYINDNFVAEMAKNEDVKVDLRNNQLSRIPKTFENIKYQNVKLSGNNFVCDCDMLWMKTWINLAPKHTDKTLSCTYDGEVYKIVDLDEDILECSDLGNLIMIVLLSVGLVIVIGLIITAKRCPYDTKVLIFKIFRIHPADNYVVDRQTDHEYDAYIAYDEDDTYVRQWVERVLVKQLEEKKPRYKLFIGVRNKKQGAEAETRIDAMEHSRRIVIILSKYFNQTDWCDYDACQAEHLKDNQGRVIFILYDEVGAEIAKQEPWLSKTKERKVFRLTERMFWSKMRYEMPRKSVKTQEKKPENNNEMNLYVIGDGS